jgi:glycosyltransferase involved in cell wall biosynthesis
VTIALDVTPLTVPTGGVTRYTLELARALSRRFPEDQYWLLSDQAFEIPETLAPNVHAGELPDSALSRRWWLWGVQREMSRRGAHVFHGTDFSVPYLKLKPAVMTLHDLSPWMDRTWQPDAGRIRRRTPRLLRLGLATMVITPSEAVRRAAIERFQLQPECVIAIPHAASEHFYPAEVHSAAKPYFLFVGTLEPRKNVGLLIEAWREVRKLHDVDLVLAGRVRRDFTAPQSEPGLTILGAVPEADLPRLYSGATAVVYPSLYEGFGLPVLEAMQCGALVVTSRDPAILEVSGGSAAIHIESDQWVRTLSAIAADPAQFADIRRRALTRASEFSWTRTAERTREVYVEARRIFRN